MSIIHTPLQPLVPGSGWTGYTMLTSQADTDIFKTTVTLASGDVKLSKDGTAFSNLGSLPTELGTTGLLVVVLTSGETSGITKFASILFHDAAGDEWQDLLLVIPATISVDTFDSLTDQVIVATNNDKTGYSLLVAPPTKNEIADQVWDETLADHLVGGSTGEALDTTSALGDPWSAPVRTLTQTAAQVVTAMTGSTLILKRGDTYSQQLTSLPSTSGYINIDFTVKAYDTDPDTSAILRVRKNISGVDDGLITLNGAVASDPTKASLTVGLNTITIAVDEEITKDLVISSTRHYDIQLITSAGVQTITEGILKITSDITKAIT